jgi:hypothetical protein
MLWNRWGTTATEAAAGDASVQTRKEFEKYH